MKLSTKCLLTTFGAAAAVGTAYAVQREVNQRKQRFDQDTGFELKEYRMINGIQQYLVHRTENDENPVLLSGYQFITGGIIMCVIGLLMGGKVHGFAAASTGMLVYLAVVSAVAYSLWGILLKYNPVSKVAVFGFMNPVFGVILSALLLGEGAQAAGVKSLIALLLVSIGIYVVNKKEGDSV